MYDARYREEQEAKYKVALECLKVLSESSILDVGCGSGLLFTQVAPTARTVVGVDSSKQLLRLAQERAREFSNVFLVLADADNLPFKKAIFSHVFAFTILQNMPKPTKTLAELSRVSTGDATFTFTGLKSAIPLETFGKMLTKAGFRICGLRDDEALRCNVVICFRSCNDISSI